MALFRITLLTCIIVAVGGCATTPPRQTANICEIFDEYPKWYDYAKESEKKWGTPVHVQMSFVHQESRFVSKARPPFEWFLFIPKGRASSARGYAQIQDPAWEDYTKANGRWMKSRSNMKDALDFIGWYNNISKERLGIPLDDPRRLYLAYHEGHGGYSRGTYRKKANLQQVAGKVEHVADNYKQQLKQCEQRFRCRRWYQFGPFCK